MRSTFAAVFCAASLLGQPVLATGADKKGDEPAAKAATNAGGEINSGSDRADASGDEVEAAAKPDIWSEEEIAQAKAYCEKVLHGVEAVLEPAEPIKEGDCGAPSPVRLISIGRNPEITVSPPVTVSCDLVAALAGWIRDDLQPLARTHLGAPIVRVRTMSSYSCRNAYGRKSTRLSEHALANAIDIGSFTTSDGNEADLLKGWGLTQRDVQAIVAEAKAAAERQRKADKKKTDKAKDKARRLVGESDAGKEGQIFLTASAGAFAPLPVRKPSAAVRQWRVRLMTEDRAATPPPSQPTRTRAKAQPGSVASMASAASHLGGPDSDAAEVTPQAFDPEDGVALFLRAAHETACERFGTVLGPEANDAHRNHFHLDMAKRKYRNYCE